MWCFENSLLTTCAVTRRSLFTELSPSCHWKQISSSSASRGYSSECIICILHQPISMTKVSTVFVSEGTCKSPKWQCLRDWITTLRVTTHNRNTKLYHLTASRVTKYVKLLEEISLLLRRTIEDISVVVARGEVKGKMFFFLQKPHSLCQLISDEYSGKFHQNL